MREDRREIELGAELGAGCELETVQSTTKNPWTECGEDVVAGWILDGGRCGGQMIVKVSADLVVLIADSLGGDGARGEEEADGLDGSGGEDDVGRFDAVGSAGGGADEDGFDAIARGGEQELRGLRVEEDAGLWVGAEFVAEGLGEVAMREGNEFGESDVELRELVEQIRRALLEVGEEGGAVVREIVYAEEVFGFFAVGG